MTQQIKEELIKYLTKIVETQEKVYWLKWTREDLNTFQSLLMIDNLTRKKDNEFFWQSLADLLTK